MVDPAGPMMAGGFETIKVFESGVEYALLFLPDKHNEELQAEGRNPVFYWLPNSMRLARKPDGDYRLSFLHFVGTQDGDTNIGVRPGQTREASGGVLSFAMTGAPPDGVLSQAHKEIMQRMQDGNNRGRFWHVTPEAAGRSTLADVRPIPIRGSTLRIMLTDQDGAGGGKPGDPFFVNAQGAGPASMTPTAEHPFIVNLGTFAAAQVEQGLLSVQTPIAVDADLTLPLWAPITRLHMTAHWERVFQHFTAQASANWWFTSADLKATWNNLRMSGDITVEIELDKTIPGADNKEEMINKYSEMLIGMWLDQAKQVIFQPMPEVQDPGPPRTGGIANSIFGWGFGAGFNLNYRRDKVEIANSFTFDIDQVYAQPHTMGGAVDGIAEVIAKDPAQRSKYLRTLYLDNWERKITTVCRPVVNWPDPDRGWHGDPVRYVSVQVGYPDVDGRIAWSAHDFTRPAKPSEVTASTVVGDGAPVADTTPADPASSTTLVYASGASNEVFFARQTQKKADEVANAPDGWRPDQVFVRRTIHFDEPPSESADPYVKLLVEVNDVDLDPGEFGTRTDKLDVPVRADHAGVLSLGPISINVALPEETDVVEVELQAGGKTAAGDDRPVVRFRYQKKDRDTERYFSVYTGQPGYLPEYRYRVRVIREGTLDAAGQEWVGAWVDGAGNGPLTVRVPRKTDPGVEVIEG
jgi:hypothetical protein